MKVVAALLVLGACVAPPATPDACRDAISFAYAGRALLDLAHDTREFESFARNARASAEEPVGAFSTQVFLRGRTIAQCLGHHWPANVVRCYRDAPTFEDCTADLPHADCVALEGALDIYEQSRPRLCGEP